MQSRRLRGLTPRSALLSQSILKLPGSSAMNSVGMGKFAQAAFRAAAGELDLAAAGCLSFTTGLGLHGTCAA